MYDLNLKYSAISKDKHLAFLKHMYSFGYDVIAWNTTVVGKVNKTTSNHIKPPLLTIDLNWNDPKVKNDFEFIKMCSLCRNMQSLQAMKSSHSSSLSTSLTDITANHIRSDNINKTSSNKSTSTLVQNINMTYTNDNTQHNNHNILLRQLSRVTLIIDDIQDAHCLNSSNEILNKFDLVAVCPGNEAIFTYCCQTAEIDIISLDFTHKSSFTYTKKLIDTAVSRGIYFEILYSTLTSSTAHIRKEVLTNTKILLYYLHSKHVIVSSGASNESLQSIRTPTDIACIASIMQMKEKNAQRAVKQNCQLALQHASLRRAKKLTSSSNIIISGSNSGVNNSSSTRNTNSGTNVNTSNSMSNANATTSKSSSSSSTHTHPYITPSLTPAAGAVTQQSLSTTVAMISTIPTAEYIHTNEFRRRFPEIYNKLMAVAPVSAATITPTTTAAAESSTATSVIPQSSQSLVAPPSLSLLAHIKHTARVTHYKHQLQTEEFLVQNYFDQHNMDKTTFRSTTAISDIAATSSTSGSHAASGGDDTINSRGKKRKKTDDAGLTRLVSVKHKSPPNTDETEYGDNDNSSDSGSDNSNDELFLGFNNSSSSNSTTNTNSLIIKS